MGPVTTLPVYMGDVPDYEVRNGQMHVILAGFELVMPLSVFLMGKAKSEIAITKWRAEQRPTACVLPFRQEFAESA